MSMPSASADEYDIVIVGAGIHGAGVAQAAAAAGYAALVLERDGVASGTSGRSSKLIHGGLRYLETGNVRLVRESLRERELLLRLAPDLVRRIAFHIPVYAHTARRPLAIRVGLSLYAVLGGMSRFTRFQALARSDWDRLDGLATAGLQAVFRYYDAQTDDAALTRAVMRSAESLGARLACPARFIRADKRRDGVEVTYEIQGGEHACRARALVNAAGPWINQVLAQVVPAVAAPAIELIQGTHIVLPDAPAGAYYLEAHDRRAVFVLPWGGRTLVGTTETPYRGDPAAVRPLAAEIDYLRDAFVRYFPARSAEVSRAFAGLRVLPRGARPSFYRPRDVVLHADDALAPRLISIYGGKLTGYRATAVRVLERLRAVLPARRPRADTARLPLR